MGQRLQKTRRNDRAGCGVMALADGGPGTGNGVVGGAAALVLGLIALGLSSVLLQGFRRVC